MRALIDYTFGWALVFIGSIFVIMAGVLAGDGQVAGAVVGAVLGVVPLLVGIWLLRGPKRRERRKVDAAEKARAEHQAHETEKLRRFKQESFDSFSAAFDALLEQHGAALLAQRRKFLTRDAYGNSLGERWEKEVRYFESTVVRRSVDPTILEGAQFHLLDTMTDDARSALILEAGELAPSTIYDAYIRTAIDAEVDRREEHSLSNIPEDVLDLTPDQFEHLCADLLREVGWEANVVAGSGDQGVDVVARRDGVTAVFQCKLYSSPLGNTPVQEIHTGRTFHDADVAAVVSNADYTAGARAAAEQTGVHLLHYSQLGTFSGATD